MMRQAVPLLKTDPPLVATGMERVVAQNSGMVISASRGGEFPTEEIYKIIDGREQKRAHGSDMPLWGDAFKRTEETDDEAVIERKIDSLVVYLKAIQERLPEVDSATE